MKNTKEQQNNEDSNLDSESDLEGSGYFESMIARQKELMQSMRNSTNSNSILLTLRQNTEIEDNLMSDFRQKAQQIAFFNKDSKSPIHHQTIKAIKEKVAAQMNSTVFSFKEDEVHKEKVLKQQARLKQSQMQEIESPMKRKTASETKQFDPLEAKLGKAATERQLIMMRREDDLSMKYQVECQSHFFAQRFISPKIPIYHQRDAKIITAFLQPKNTFTNLRPMPNTNYNVLPKNAPEIALRAMKKAKKLTLNPESVKAIPLVFKKVGNQQKQQQKQKKQQKPSKVRDVPPLKVSFIPPVQENTKSVEFLDETLRSYISSIKGIFLSIEKSCQSYRPKFIKQFLQGQQKAMNIDLNDTGEGKQKTLQSIVQMGDIVSLNSLRELTFTFESLTKLTGIEHYKAIESAALQYNLLKDISALDNCKKLIEVNLSHNKLKNLSIEAKTLPWLKFINAEHNFIDRVNLPCESLEVALLSNNRIEIVEAFGINIRTLDLSHNTIQDIKGISESHFLQELNLMKNRVKSLSGLQKCILLRRLNLSRNRIEGKLGVQKVVFLFLNELNLNNNYISSLPCLFLPSLQKLYLEHNKLKEHPNQTIYLPNLRVLNVDDNSLEGFAVVWTILRYSKDLQMLKYDDNQCFLRLRDEVRALYQYIIFKNMKAIKILNQNAADVGLKKFYESAYGKYLNSSSMFLPRSKLLQHLQQKVNFVLKENQTIAFLQTQRTKFSETSQFISYKSIQMAENLLQIAEFVESKEGQLFRIRDSIFHLNDLYEIKYRQSIHRIRSLVVMFMYRKRKRERYYRKNGDFIWKAWQNIYSICQRLKLRRAFQELVAVTRRFNKEEAAIYIQKMWKGFRTRRRFIKILHKLKNNKDQDDDFDLPQIDVDDMFKGQEQNHRFNFQIPEHLSFQDYIIRPQVFTLLQQQRQKGQDKIREKQKKETKPKVNNFFEGEGTHSQMKNESIHSQSISERRSKQEEQDQRLMKQWGFKDKKSLQGFKLKRKKKQQAQRKERQKTMTAAERLQRFKKNH